MSTPHLSPPTQRTCHPEPNSTEAPPASTDHSTCACGTPANSGTWIRCDNPGCLISWYHRDCVDVTATSFPREWFCPTCRPSSTSTSTMPPTTDAKKVPAGPTRSVNKKGVAIKKSTPKKKGSSKRAGWIEVASEDEDEDEGGVKIPEDAETAAVRAKTKETMILATKSGARVKKSRTPVEGEGGKSKTVEAGREDGEVAGKGRTASYGGIKGEDGHGNGFASPRPLRR